jgi:UDP-N-acetylglucosamine--N-acetylmuramyl-(pentapeptide) pyrophosphoryl-undecaprenol N-acetylglucosamine transferase
VTGLVIAGGGTGGHLFPGLAVAAELTRSGARVSWLGARRGLEATRVPEAGIPTRLLSVSGAVARSRAAQVGAVLQLTPAVLQAAAFLLRSGAAAVLPVGGYAALPGALAAGMLGIPIVLQEQNALPGLTTRFLAPWSVAVACGFEAALPAFPSLPARWTGNPVRPEFFTVPPPTFRPVSVLVLGGSQGSAFLNAVAPDAFAELSRRGIAPRIVHQAGPRWSAGVAQRYAALGIAATVVPFIERPADALAEAALVLARAGALTVTELAAARRAAILVPFAAAAHGHQLANAAAFASTGAAEVLEESEASAARLAAVLERALKDPERLVERGVAGARLARPDAARTVADLLIRAGGGLTGGGR